jgi:hypothetical protein
MTISGARRFVRAIAVARLQAAGLNGELSVPKLCARSRASVLAAQTVRARTRKTELLT